MTKSHELTLTLFCCCLFLLTAGSLSTKKYPAITELLDNGQPEKAMIAIKKLLATNPEDPEVRCTQAQALSQLRHPKEALVIVDDLLRTDPKSAEAHYRRGRILNDLGDRNGGFAEMQNAIKLKPDWSEARSACAVLMFRAGNAEGAISQLDQAIKSSPRLGIAWANRGAIFFRLGHFERAKSDLDKALALEPNEPEHLNNRGRTLHAMRRYDEAIKDFDKAIKLAPKKSDWYNNKGLALVGLKRFADAVPWYTKAAELNPDDATAFGNRGAAYVRMKRLKEGESDLRQAIKINPKYATAHNNLAALMLIKGKMKSAQAESDKALELEPDSTVLHANRARILATQGKFDESLYDYESAKTNGAEQGDATPVSANDFQTLIATYDRVLRLHPNDKDTYYNRAFVYFCMKKMPLALKDLDVFLRMSSSNSKGALNAAIIASFAHRYSGHDARESKKPLDAVLKNTSSLKSYWGWNVASYLAGNTPVQSLNALKLNKSSQTQLRCYYAIDRSLAGDLDAAKKEFDWIKTFGDREIDEFDLAMSWFSTKKRTVNPALPASIQPKRATKTK